MAGKTPRQREQARRSWRIFQIRALWSQAYLLTGWRAKVARWAIDEELKRIGAEPEGLRRDLKVAWRDGDTEFDEVPF